MADANIIYEGGAVCMGAPGAYCARTHWRITDKYIEKESGLCCTSIDNVQLIRVKDIAYRPGCCCCGFCGDIVVYSSDETSPELHMKGIPNAKDVYKNLRDAISKIQGNARLEIQT